MGRGLAIGLLAAAVVFPAGAAPAAQRQRAALFVEQVHVPGSPFYVEGSLSYVRVDGRPGVVATRRLTKTRRAQARLSLVPGRYRLTSWQRPCDGNCGYLDPPTDRCAAGFRARPGAVVRATVRLFPGRGCRIVVR